MVVQLDARGVFCLDQHVPPQPLPNHPDPKATSTGPERLPGVPTQQFVDPGVRPVKLPERRVDAFATGFPQMKLLCPGEIPGHPACVSTIPRWSGHAGSGSPSASLRWLRVAPKNCSRYATVSRPPWIPAARL